MSSEVESDGCLEMLMSKPSLTHMLYVTDNEVVRQKETEAWNSKVSVILNLASSKAGKTNKK